MFGLEDGKNKKKNEEFVFDIEKELQDAVKKTAYIKQVQTRMLKLKEILHAGVDQKSLKHISVLLEGYSALFKVISRKPRPKFK